MKPNHLYAIGAVALAFGAGPAFAAPPSSPVTFTAPGKPVVSNISVFDWLPSDVLAKNGNQAVADYINSGGTCSTTGTGCKFDTYIHGNLGTFTNGTTPVGTPKDNGYQVTFVMGFSEKVIAVAGSTAIFGFGPTGKTSGPYNAADEKMSDGTTPNFFKMYYNNNLTANPLSGNGFMDGTLIMQGTIAPTSGFSSLFSVTGGPSPIGGNNGTTPAAWSGVTSVEGTGSTSDLNVMVAISYIDTSFFAGQTFTKFLMGDIGQKLTFNTVDPSLSFPEGGVASTKAIVGSVNGGLSCPTGPGSCVVSGPSITFQSDPNSPVGVPEPASLALMGLGLAGLGAARRRSAGK